MSNPAVAKNTIACSCATSDKQAVVPCVETYVLNQSVCCVCMQMDAAQQYNTNGRGYVPLLDWAKQHTQKLHAPPAGQQVVITSGSNHAIDVSFSLMLFAAKPFWCRVRLQVHKCSGEIWEQRNTEDHIQNLVFAMLHVASVWHVWHVAI